MSKIEYYSNKRLYTVTGKRAAVFIRNSGKDEAELFELFTSKSDQFSRNLAEEVYKTYLREGIKEYKNEIYPEITYNGVKYHPNIITYVGNTKDSIQYKLKQYCKHYYKKGKIHLKYQVEVLYKNKELIILQETKKLINKT